MNWLKRLFNKKETTSDNSEVMEIIPIMLEKYQIPFHLIIKFNGEVSYKCDIPDNLNKEIIHKEIERNINIVIEGD